jgi:hypothetical protein
MSRTLIFWDYADCDPERMGTTVPKFTKRLSDFLRDHKIKAGGSVITAYVREHTLQQKTMQQLQDLSVSVVSLASAAQIKGTLVQDLRGVVQKCRPPDATIVILASDKDLVPHIKFIADDHGFSVSVIHAFSHRDDSSIELLETFATNCFHVSDVVPEAAAALSARSTPVMGSFSVTGSDVAAPLLDAHLYQQQLMRPVANFAAAMNTSILGSQQSLQQTPAVRSLPSVPPVSASAAPVGKQVFVDGALVRLDDLIQNEGYRKLSSGKDGPVSWCKNNPMFHDVVSCTKLHRKIAANQLPNTAVLQPPPPVALGTFAAQSVDRTDAAPFRKPLPTYSDHVIRNSPPLAPTAMSVSAAPFYPMQLQQEQQIPPPLPAAATWQRTAPALLQESGRQAVVEAQTVAVTAWDTPATSKEIAAQSMNQLLFDTAIPPKSALEHQQKEKKPADDDFLKDFAMQMLGASILNDLQPSGAPSSLSFGDAGATSIWGAPTVPVEKTSAPAVVMDDRKIASKKTSSAVTNHRDGRLSAELSTLPLWSALSLPQAQKDIGVSSAPKSPAGRYQDPFSDHATSQSSATMATKGVKAPVSPAKSLDAPQVTRAKPSSKTENRKLPARFNIEGESVPIGALVQNRFIEEFNGSNAAYWCSETRPHSLLECRYAHRYQFQLLQGGSVDGDTLIRNSAYDTLLANSHFRGNFCTSTKKHDIMKCSYLHKK